jgi:hypothetical protein
MGRRSRQPALRTHKIPAQALENGRRLMGEQSAATVRYNDWANDTVAAMNLGEPREGHIWLVDPPKGTISEAKR